MNDMSQASRAHTSIQPISHGHDTSGWAGFLERQRARWPTPEAYFIAKVRYLQPLLRAICTAMPSGSRILQTGVGSGVISIYLSLLGYRTVGIDLNTEVIEQAQLLNTRLHGAAEFVRQDMFELRDRFAADEFDCATSAGTLEHFDDHDIVRTLVDQFHVGQRIIFTVPGPRKPQADLYGDERLHPARKWRQLVRAADGIVTRTFGYEFEVRAGRLSWAINALVESVLSTRLYSLANFYGFVAVRGQSSPTSSPPVPLVQ